MSMGKALLLACGLLASNSALAARSDWRQMTVGHFHLYSTMRDSKTRDVARQLQAFEKAVGGFLPGDGPQPDVPVFIYMLDRDDFLHFGTNRPDVAAALFDNPFAAVIAIDRDVSFDIIKVSIFHDYAHYLLRNSSAKIMPPWFVEGYAELLSGFKLKQDKATIGELPPGIDLNLKEWIPMEKLLTVESGDPDYRNERLAPQFYGESWALIHVLLFDDESLRRPTMSYIDNVGAGMPEPDAFAQAFPFDRKTLDDSTRKLLKERVVHQVTVPCPPAAAVESAPISSITAAQADVELTRMAFRIGWPIEITPDLAAAALQESPTDPAVRALSARIAALKGKFQDIEDLKIVLEKGGAEDAQLRIDVAGTVLTQAQSKLGAERALAILHDLVNTDPAPLEAVWLWAIAAERAGIAPAQRVDLLERSSARAPHNTLLLQLLAPVHELLGDTDRARDDYHRIALFSGNPHDRLWAQKRADSIRTGKN